MFKINDIVTDKAGNVFQVIDPTFRNDKFGKQILCRKYRSQRRSLFMPWQIKKHPFFQEKGWLDAKNCQTILNTKKLIMNQVSKKPREENNLNRAFWKHDRRINLAKKEIQIFLNASERIKDMGLDKVSVEYLQESLHSVLQELER